MGSKVCRRIAVRKGWAKPGLWRDDYLFNATDEERRKKKREAHRRWYQKNKVKKEEGK